MFYHCYGYAYHIWQTVTIGENMWPVVTMGNWLDVSGDHNHGNPGVMWLVTMPMKRQSPTHTPDALCNVDAQFFFGLYYSHCKPKPMKSGSVTQHSTAHTQGIMLHVAHNMYTRCPLPFIYLWRNKKKSSWNGILSNKLKNVLIFRLDISLFMDEWIRPLDILQIMCY